MVLDFVESRVANPVKVADWSDVDEARGVLCPCCGWLGRLGECETAALDNARAYSCGQCAMPLVIRALPNVIPMRMVADYRAWERWDRMIANL